jgi:hypothetical protein
MKGTHLDFRSAFLFQESAACLFKDSSAAYEEEKLNETDFDNCGDEK